MIKQRLHVKKLFKKFLNSIKLFLLFSTEIFSTEYRDVAYVLYRDVQVPRCPDTVQGIGIVNIMSDMQHFWSSL